LQSAQIFPLNSDAKEIKINLKSKLESNWIDQHPPFIPPRRGKKSERFTRFRLKEDFSPPPGGDAGLARQMGSICFTKSPFGS
jgi:hypothetical protein